MSCEEAFFFGGETAIHTPLIYVAYSILCCGAFVGRSGALFCIIILVSVLYGEKDKIHLLLSCILRLNFDFNSWHLYIQFEDFDISERYKVLPRMD